jgi:hypothetical protein
LDSFAHNLDDVPYPPASVSGGAACHTRTASVGSGGFTATKIPLYPTAYSTAAASNNVNLNAFPSGAPTGAGGACTTQDTVGPCHMPPAALGVTRGFNPYGSDGVTIDGSELYPIYNNIGVIDAAQCNQDGCSSHVGGGGGQPHHHGDPFGPTCLYSAASYASSTAHPPIIGFALDGYGIYGRHLYDNSLGADKELDLCGGHTHDGVEGYHYHSQILKKTIDQSTVRGEHPFLFYSPPFFLSTHSPHRAPSPLPLPPAISPTFLLARRLRRWARNPGWRWAPATM